MVILGGWVFLMSDVHLHHDCESFYLTECINQMVLESQLHHKIVHLLFTTTNQNDKSTVFWGN